MIMLPHGRDSGAAVRPLRRRGQSAVGYQIFERLTVLDQGFGDKMKTVRLWPSMHRNDIHTE